MKSIGDIVASTRKKEEKKHISKEIDEKTVLFVAERIILSQYGVRGRENIIPKSFRERKISFLCRSSLWMNELWMNRDIFLEKMNNELGDGCVADMKISEMF